MAEDFLEGGFKHVKRRFSQGLVLKGDFGAPWRWSSRCTSVGCMARGEADITLAVRVVDFGAFVVVAALQVAIDGDSQADADRAFGVANRVIIGVEVEVALSLVEIVQVQRLQRSQDPAHYPLVGLGSICVSVHFWLLCR